MLGMNKVNNENKRTNMDLTAVSKNILPLARKLLGKKGMMEFEILANWEKIAGADLAAYSIPEKVDFKNNERINGVLHLTVPSGAFALELKHRERHIIDKVNTFFGYAAVSAIKIMQNNEMQFYEKPVKTQKRKKRVVVSQEEENYINEAGALIKDDKLKEILIKLGYSVFSENNISDNSKDK